jgi:hypothetical protein
MEIARMTKKKSSLPREAIFITAFEQYVAEKQVQIRIVESMQGAFNAVRSVLLEAGPPGASLRLRSIYDRAFYVQVDLVASKDDVRATFDSLSDKVGKALKDCRFHATGEPAIEWGGYDRKGLYTWRPSEKDKRRVCIEVDAPDGLRDVAWKYTGAPPLQLPPRTAWRAVPREPVVHGHDPRLQTIAALRSELDALKREMDGARRDRLSRVEIRGLHQRV